MAKVRLTPLNRSSLKTVPRIELNAAKIGIELQQKIKKETDLNFDSEYFWSDSSTVLGYIKSDSGRFQRFVANMVAYIRSFSDVNQWRFVPTKENIADLLSRGAKTVASFVECNEWKNGPIFLYRSQEDWPSFPGEYVIYNNDIELKKNTIALATAVNGNPVLKLLNSTSDWLKLKFRVATILRIRRICLSRNFNEGEFSHEELENAEHSIWRYIQKLEFEEIYNSLEAGKLLPKKHFMLKLSPDIDHTGLLRVGGRLRLSDLPDNTKHPIILPKNYYAVRLLVESVHNELGHFGKELILTTLRQNYYVIGASTLVKNIVHTCLICRRYNGKPSEQIMSDLPPERITGDLPVFNTTGTDYFGPFFVTRGRSRAQEKRFGVIFTCFASRAMHIEIAHSLDTSSFINALRRFVSRRGPVKYIRSDNGTNFVGGSRELKESIQEWNSQQIDNWCKSNGITWKFNPPAASHFGGVWEREIRSIRKVLNSMLAEQPAKSKINDETLLTLMCEVENILNSRPLTALSSDPNDLEPLTPNHLLLLHNGVSFPPGVFNKDDNYSRRRWRKVQYLADTFWYRWKKEYLLTLNFRQKWTQKQRSHQVGDLVLVVDQNLPQNLWCMGRIVQVIPDDEGNVRVAKIKVSRYRLGDQLKTGITYLERPISKLVLLRNVDEL